jgi:parallel beta-helix repeat protein
VVGNAVFDNAVTGLLNRGVRGTTLAAATITTTGTQTYGGTMTLGAPLVTLVGTTGSFGGGVAGAGNSLAINLSGATAIDGATFSGIHDLSTGGGGSTTLVGSVITTGIQSYGDAVTLAGDASLATGGGNVLFGNHLDGARNLSINAGTGLVTFAQAVGATNPLGSLAIHSAAGVTASSTVALDGSAVGAAPNGLVIATGVNAVDMHVAGSTVRNYSGSGIILQSSLASTVSGFTVEDNGAYGVFVEGDVSGSVVSGNTIQGNVVGVYLAGAGGLLVNGANQILGNTAYGIYGSGTAASTTTIAGNLVDGQGVSSYGAFLDNAKNIHIGAAGLGGGNTISHAAIGIYAADGLASSRVINNVIDHNGSGVVLMHTRHLAIEGANQLLDNASFGILAQGAFLDTSISGNTISGSIVGVNLSDATGIVVDGGNQILGNTAHGVYAVGDGTDSIVRGNSINGSGVGAFGVFLDGVAGLTLGGTLGGEGNTVTGSSIGLYARGSLAGTAVRGNTFDANGSGAVIAAAADLLINTGNHFTHSTSYGLLAQGVCDGTVIAGNTLGTSAVGLGLSGATGLVVNGGNQLVGNTSLGMYATGVADGSRVTGNTIDGIGSGVFGMFLDGVTGLVAGDTGVGNDVTGWQVGVYARGALGGSVVASNIVTGNGTGAVLTGATGLLVNGGNRFGDSTAYGLLAEGASDGSVVAGNLIDANVVGVCIVGASGLTVRDGNQILGNSAQGVYATGDATGTKVVGNTINGVGTGAFGVFLDGVTGMTVGELPAGGINTITGYSNGIYAQGNLLGSTVANNALTGNQSGIVLVSASDLAVRDGNRVIGSSAFGLYGSGDCAGTVVEANSFEGNSSGVVLDGARNLNIVNLNRMISNTAFGLYAKGVSTGTTVMGNTISGNGQNVETSAATGGTFQTS